MQTLTLEGYLAADPSILSAQGSGKKRASFRVVETTRFRRANGEPGERTTGFNCICFNEATAENYIQPYARKGSRVVIQGHVENDTWTGKNGATSLDAFMTREVQDQAILDAFGYNLGVIETEHHEQFTTPERMAEYRKETPVQRNGQAAEVAATIAFLASDAASFLNGAILDINGGRFLR